MSNGKKAMALYRALILRTAKWIMTAALVISAIIVILGIADAIIPGLNWNYSWQAISFALLLFVISAVIRRVIVNALSRSSSETHQPTTGN